MSSQDLVALASQLGVGGAVLLVIIRVIIPLFQHESAATREAIKAGAKSTAEAVDRNTLMLERHVVIIADLGERVSRIEGALDHRDAASGNGYDHSNLRPTRR